MISLTFNSRLGFLSILPFHMFHKFVSMPIMDRAAETEVNSIYAWKWPGSSAGQLHGLGVAVRQGWGFVVTLITSVHHGF